MKSYQFIIVSLIIGISMIITAKMFTTSVSSVIKQCDANRLERILNDNKNRYQIEIITDKGQNWNGIYVFDKMTGNVKFYSSSDSF